jgi:hypothetical protein
MPRVLFQVPFALCKSHADYPFKLFCCALSFDAFSDDRRSSDLDVFTNLMFNGPIALMMIATIIIFSEWVDIHQRCVQMTKNIAAGSSRVFGALFSKLPM